jgi:hypothetical protein
MARILQFLLAKSVVGVAASGDVSGNPEKEQSKSNDSKKDEQQVVLYIKNIAHNNL